MNLDLFGTTTDMKARWFSEFKEAIKSHSSDNIDEFLALISNQFHYGGKKYGGIMMDREATDVICHLFGGESGVDWVLGTMVKYIMRYKNFGQEKDLLKIATYCYILWLKAGFHLLTDHQEDINASKS